MIDMKRFTDKVPYRRRIYRPPYHRAFYVLEHDLRKGDKIHYDDYVSGDPISSKNISRPLLGVREVYAEILDIDDDRERSAYWYTMRLLHSEPQKVMLMRGSLEHIQDYGMPDLADEFERDLRNVYAIRRYV